MGLLVFGRGGTRVFAFPMRFTSCTMYERRGVVAALAPLVVAGRLQLFCVDAVDDLTYDSRRRLQAFDHQERYVLDELLPLAERLNPGTALATFGLCLGAFHAVDLAVRNPGVFSRVVALSGRYDLTRPAFPYKALLSRADGDHALGHTPNAALPRLDPEARCRLRGMAVVLGAGRNDPFLASTRKLDHALADLGVEAELYTWGGRARSGAVWRALARHAFESEPAAPTASTSPARSRTA